MNKINIAEKMSLFQEYWSPKILGELNDSYIKAAKLKGDFIWHSNDLEDEMFFVVKGHLEIRLRDKSVFLNEGEFIIIPHSTEHMPVAEEEVEVLLIEAKATLNTREIRNERTVDAPEWI